MQIFRTESENQNAVIYKIVWETKTESENQNAVIYKIVWETKTSKSEVPYL